MNEPDSNLVIHKSVLLLCAVGLAAFEFFIPRIPLFPWIKPGLANCVTLVWIIHFGAIDALLFMLLRVWTLGFYFGFSFFTLALSLSGGIAATCAMGCAWHLLGKRRLLGLAGMGITGAFVHNAAQLCVVFVLMARNRYLFYQIPVMLFASVLFGTVVSLLVPLLDDLVESAIAGRGHGGGQAALGFRGERAAPRDTVLSLLMFGFCIALLFVSSLSILAASAAAVTLAVQMVEHGSFRDFIRPVSRFWMLFLAVAAFHLLLSYGTRIEQVPILTHEGVREAGRQWLRLWTWLQMAGLLRTVKFHIVLLSLLHKAFRGRSDTIYAGLIALEYFPATVDAVRKNALRDPGTAFTNPVRWSRHAVVNTVREITGCFVRGTAQEAKPDPGSA